MILLAGDCTGSAYIFSPSLSFINGDKTVGEDSYQFAFEIECGATVSLLRFKLMRLLNLSQVGSAAFASSNDGSGCINLYVPSYELNKV
jgi:hypothetical protein